VYRSRIPYLPIPFDSGQVEELIDRLVETFRGRCPSVPAPLARRMLRDAIPVPDEASPFRPGPFGRTLHTPAQRTWVPIRPEAVGRKAPPQGEPALGHYLVVGPQGEVEAVVELPARFTPWVVDDPLVWGVLRDELGVNYVTRLRLREGG